ncbi:MAG: ABC transporter permease [Halobacteriales archaeon]|nr:ABC transporter permease [Halobacteriales archaeon]
MELIESIRLSVRALRGHKLRSTLTTLGIVIGIAAVIAFVTLGTSVKADIVGEVGGTGADEIYLFAVAPDDDGPPDPTAQPVFTEHDLASLRNLEGVAQAIPRGSVPVSAIRVGNETLARDRLTASTPALFTKSEFIAGGPFTAGEREVVINEAASEVFERNLSVGDRIQIVGRDGEPQTVRVAGIIADSAAPGPFSGFDTEPRLYLPTDPFYNTVVESPSVGVRQRVYPQVTVIAADPGETPTVKTRVTTYLADSDARQLVPDAYRVIAQTNEDITERVSRILDRLTSFVTGIAVISLLVGAIGIANIMLVSVRERTREIGIMKAVGARNRDVLQLFLVESVLLGLLGALIGIPLGLLGAFLAAQYVEVSLVIAPIWPVIATVVGVTVGIVAGLYPAWNATTVDPIEALRYE